MIVPNKFITFQESALSKLKYILEVDESYSISDLYTHLEDQFDGLDQFLFALDVLYLLDELDLDDSKGQIIKCL